MNESNGICLLTYIPVRSGPSEQSEMVSQLLFGELFTVFETDRNRSFSRIKMVHDGYEGWIDSKTITPLDNQSFAELGKWSRPVVTRPLILKSAGENSQQFLLSAGSLLNGGNNSIDTPQGVFDVPGEALAPHDKDPRETIVTSGQYFMNVPYLWGGRSSYGTDCSGLVQNLFRQAGITLPRDASQQAMYGTTLSFLSEARPGDLAFFDNEEGEITHVGIIVSENTILHASGRVRIDRMDHQGIYAEEFKKYTHKLRVLKNVITK